MPFFPSNRIRFNKSKYLPFWVVTQFNKSQNTSADVQNESKYLQIIEKKKTNEDFIAQTLHFLLLELFFFLHSKKEISKLCWFNCVPHTDPYTCTDARTHRSSAMCGIKLASYSYYSKFLVCETHPCSRQMEHITNSCINKTKQKKNTNWYQSPTISNNFFHKALKRKKNSQTKTAHYEPAVCLACWSVSNTSMERLIAISTRWSQSTDDNIYNCEITNNLEKNFIASREISLWTHCILLCVGCIGCIGWNDVFITSSYDGALLMSI